MYNSIIIIAEIFEEGAGGGQVTEIFDTEFITQAYTMMEKKYAGMDIEYLYVFDNSLNMVDRIKIIINPNYKIK